MSPTISRWPISSVAMSSSRSRIAGFSHAKLWTKYSVIAVNSPDRPPNCSSSFWANHGSISPTLTGNNGFLWCVNMMTSTCLEPWEETASGKTGLFLQMETISRYDPEAANKVPTRAFRVELKDGRRVGDRIGNQAARVCAGRVDHYPGTIPSRSAAMDGAPERCAS